jgi:thioredoxin reductase (NADPH)
MMAGDVERATETEVLDVLVVAAGPCGIAAAVAARAQGLSCRLVERGAVTQAMIEHPTYTTYFSGPEKLEIGGIPFTIAGDKPTRREALRYYRRVVTFYGLDVLQYHDVTRVERGGDLFVCHAVSREGQERWIRSRNLVVATGYYDNPRKLDVPGSDLAKVAYYYREPFAYFDQDVVVLGGGNSAADAALSCWREGARVTIVHQFAELDPGVKPWVRPDLENRIAEGVIPAFWRHVVRVIRPGEVVIESLDGGERRVLRNDWVLAMIGYTPNPRLLLDLGVSIDPVTGIPTHEASTMRTNVTGVYLAGVVAAGYDANKIFIENGKLHGDRIAGAIASRS